jgi:hypothetical protein
MMPSRSRASTSRASGSSRHWSRPMSKTPGFSEARSLTSRSVLSGAGAVERQTRDPGDRRDRSIPSSVKPEPSRNSSSTAANTRASTAARRSTANERRRVVDGTPLPDTRISPRWTLHHQGSYHGGHHV